MARLRCLELVKAVSGEAPYRVGGQACLQNVHHPRWSSGYVLDLLAVSSHLRQQPALTEPYLSSVRACFPP